MKFRLSSSLLIITITLLALASCSKKEDFVTEPLNDYLPLQTGKYITYRVDSLVFTNFGRNTETHSYEIKHVVDAEITDNLGRPAWRIYTYIRDTAETQDWTANSTYYITPLTNQIELVEDNLRVIKLHAPLKEGYDWKGNTYLPDEPYRTNYDFNNDNDMRDWDFTYQPVESSLSYRGNTYQDVYTVLEQDDSFNVPITDVTKYAYKTLAVEQYSKTVGLVFRQLEMWEYQPNTSGPSPYKTGFGITMWMIDHN